MTATTPRRLTSGDLGTLLPLLNSHLAFMEGTTTRDIIHDLYFWVSSLSSTAPRTTHHIRERSKAGCSRGRLTTRKAWSSFIFYLVFRLNIIISPGLSNLSAMHDFNKTEHIKYWRRDLQQYEQRDTGQLSEHHCDFHCLALCSPTANTISSSSSKTEPSLATDASAGRNKLKMSVVEHSLPNS